MKRKPHRCYSLLDEWITDTSVRHGVRVRIRRRRRCLRRRSLYPGEEPVCSRCRRSDRWKQVDRKKDRRRENCTSGLCEETALLGDNCPHSHYSAGCHRNPTRSDWGGKVKKGGVEPPF